MSFVDLGYVVIRSLEKMPSCWFPLDVYVFWVSLSGDDLVAQERCRGRWGCNSYRLHWGEEFALQT